jgi:hypothetical protein
MRTTVFKTGGTIGPELKKGEKKYVSAVSTFLRVPVLDKDGKQEYKTDAKGNNKLPVFKQVDFTYIPRSHHADGRNQQESWYLITSKEIHGDDYEWVAAELDRRCKNPSYCIATEEEFYKKSNPEAFKQKLEKEALKAELSEKDAKISELEKRLGFKKA